MRRARTLCRALMLAAPAALALTARVAVLLAAVCSVAPAAAQGFGGLGFGGLGFGGLRLGDPVPDTMPPPDASQRNAVHSFRLWQLDGGLTLLATADAETGEVLYMEMWPTVPGTTPASSVPGFTHGLTTRTDITRHFGSDGLVFDGRGRGAVVEANAVHFLSYEIADSPAVLSFVTLQPLAEVSEATAGQSVLDIVILAQGAYLTLIWGGNRDRLPGYAPIPDPFAAQ